MQVESIQSDAQVGSAKPAHETVWGMDADGLHDRFWAAARVEVIRCGSGKAPSKEPALYLLIAPGDLVLFRLDPVVKQLSWMKPRAVRLRVADSTGEHYAERVSTGDDGRVMSIDRRYAPRLAGTRRVMLTDRASVAERWANSSDPIGAFRELRERVGRRAILPMTTSGRVFDADSVDSKKLFVSELARSWRNLSDAIDGIYQYKPGVWVHESARPAPMSRLVGPLWVGAGVTTSDDEVHVGPGTINDTADALSEFHPVSWTHTRPPGWRVVPRIRRRRLRRMTKRIFDIVFAGCVLIATAPLYPIVAFLIWREDGWPIFFAHTRQTVNGRAFPCYKFRTMRNDAESMKAELAEANQADGPQFFIRDDPRLLRIGKVLRNFQIDELPQFVNVLLGHMSVVGPRPSPDDENQFCPAWREARLSVRPGVTGLWQIRRTRRPQTDFQEWIRYDLEYVQHDTWRLDIWIILETILQIIRRG